MSFQRETEFLNAFKIFQDEVKVPLVRNRVKMKEELDKLFNSENYKNLALPHLSRFDIYKNFAITLLDEITLSLKSIFVTDIHINKEDQNKIVKYIKELLHNEEQKIIDEETQLLKRKNSGLNLSAVIIEISYLFATPFFEFERNTSIHLRKGELNEKLKAKRDLKNRITDLKWKLLWHILTLIIGIIIGYIFAS